MKLIILLSLSALALLISSCTQVPDACFTANKTTIKVNDTVQFSAACTKNATSYNWNFGDQSFATGQVVTHKFTGAASLTVTLTATNSSKSASVVKAYTITN